MRVENDMVAAAGVVELGQTGEETDRAAAFAAHYRTARSVTQLVDVALNAGKAVAAGRICLMDI